MFLKRQIVRQFARPTGVLGGVAGRLMARRSSNRIRNERTVEMMHLGPRMQVLEVGCGPGLALLDCARTVTEGRVVGIDHSGVMIAQSRARLAAAGLLDRVELVTGGIEALDRLDRRFDRALSLNVIQFIADKRDFFAKVHSVLVPGGMCFTTYQPRLERDARVAANTQVAAIVEAMQAAGFDTIESTEIAAGETAAMCVSGMTRRAPGQSVADAAARCAAGAGLPGRQQSARQTAGACLP